MQNLSRHSAWLRRLAWLGVLPLFFAAGCTRPIYPVDIVADGESCIDDARAVRFQIQANMGGLTWQGGTPNIIGTPTITDLGGLFEVVAELDHVPQGGQVTLRFSANAIFQFAGLASGLDFFTVPPPNLPAAPDCGGGDSPLIVLSNDVHLGLKMEVSNPSPPLMTLVQLELTEAPSLLPGSELDWSNPVFNALPWQAALPGGTPIDSQAPPLVIDLPDQVGPATNATLLRFVSVAGGRELRGIVEVDLFGPLGVRSATWGTVKAKYRN